MTIRRHILALWGLAFLTFAGCDISILDRGVPGSGVAATENRDIESFTKIEFAGGADIAIACGSAPSLKVTTDDNLMDLIDTQVVDGVLKIRFSEKVSPKVTPKFVITTEQLDELEIAGAASCKLRGLDGESLKLKIAGAGKVVAEGTVKDVEIDIAGAGRIDGVELIARNMDVDVAGSGAVTVSAIDHLKVSIAGSGSIKYYGDPDLEQSIMGAGSVQHLGDLPAEATKEGSASEQGS